MEATNTSNKLSKNQIPQDAVAAPKLWQKPGQIWNNMSIRAKIASLLLTAAAVPVLVTTQGIVGLAREVALNDLKSSLQTKLLILDKFLESETRQIDDGANALAQSVEAAGINLDDLKNGASGKLNSFLDKVQAQKPNASFYLITNSRGQTIAQTVQVVKDDFSKYPALPQAKLTAPGFSPISVPSGTELGDLDIVKSALDKSRGLSGIELLKSSSLQKLGLAQQSNIGIRKQQIQGLTEDKKPYPENTFDIDQGKAGLVVMSVRPIQVNGRQVGTAIVGTLVNRNFEMVDRLKSETNVSTATLFAQDWRVSTNVPYSDKTTRAIGTKASKAVVDKVLKQNQTFVGSANIIGTEYVTGYAPLYDHNRQLDATKAKPIGIAYVGEPQTQVDSNLQKVTATGFAIGGGILLAVLPLLIFAPTDRSISRPIRRLTKFASQIAAGESGVRLADDQRRDEIGILSNNLNQMAGQIEVNLSARQQEAEQQRQQREELETGILNLVNEVGGAVNGDLTVRANLNSLELSTVADVFNATIDSLRDIAIEVKQSSNQVNDALLSNEKDIREMSNQAISEAAEIRGTFGSLTQMTDSIRAVSTNASQASSIANDAYTVVQESSTAMEQTVNSIVGLRQTISESSKKMKRLGESSQKISQVVKLIDEIALKTNLLAINASVEAGRAGEQGQGFTIVAEQVGALAEQSAAATQEIAQIIADIQAETKDVATVMELGTTQVVDGTRLVETTKEKLNQVLKKSQEINTLMSSISTATVSQAEASQVVTELMQQVTAASDERSALSIQMASSMQKTSQVAKKLEEKVAQFRV